MHIFCLITLFLAVSFGLFAECFVGVSTSDITPPIGTPLAGYEKRKGAPMQGVQDPLLATCMIIDNVVFCSVDHLGMPYGLIQKIQAKAKMLVPELEKASFFIGSTHTHSGGGAYYDLPVIGEMLAGPYDEKIADGYVDGIVKAIVEAASHKEPALVGIGYAAVDGVAQFRSKWPERYVPEEGLSLIKVTKKDGAPLALLYSYALHPTVLGHENMRFSADFVGASRDLLHDLLGKEVVTLYFNGAQAELVPQEGTTCQSVGKQIAAKVYDLWKKTEVDETISLRVKKHSYSFTPKTTPYGLSVPLEKYDTEISLLTVNKKDLFVAVPGELSALYAVELKQAAKKRGYTNLTVLGLVNDAHGYIIMPEAWHAKTAESALSFGGPLYGKELCDQILNMLSE